MSTWLAPGIASLGLQEIHPLIIHALSVGHWAGDGIGQRFQQKGLIVHNLFQINNFFMLAYFLFLLVRGLSLHSLLLSHTWGCIGLTQGGPDGTLGRYLPIGWDSDETWIGIKVMFKLFNSHFRKGRIHLLPTSTQSSKQQAQTILFATEGVQHWGKAKMRTTRPGTKATNDGGTILNFRPHSFIP